MIRRAALAAVLALAPVACGPRGAADFCGTIKTSDVEQALGATLSAESGRTGMGSETEIACAWSGTNPEGEARNLALTVQRAAGDGAYELAVADLEARYGRVGTLADIGDAATMGVGEADAVRFAAQIVARKGADLLIMRIDGRDPAAFEQIARAAAAAM